MDNEVNITGFGKISIQHYDEEPTISCDIEKPIVSENISHFIELCISRGFLKGDKKYHIQKFYDAILEQKTLLQLGSLNAKNMQAPRDRSKLCDQYYPRLLEDIYEVPDPTLRFGEKKEKKKKHKRKKKKKKKTKKKKLSRKKKLPKKKYLTKRR